MRFEIFSVVLRGEKRKGKNKKLGLSVAQLDSVDYNHLSQLIFEVHARLAYLNKSL